MTSPQERRETLRDGSVVLLRPLAREDADELVRAFGELSRESRYRRFLESVERLTPEQVRYLTDIDKDKHVAWCAVTPEGRGVAVARSIRDAHGDCAEYAITVVDEWQGRGIGKVLTIALARAAWATGVRHFKATMFADNTRVLRILASVGDEVERRQEDRGTIEVVYALRAPT